MKFNHTNIWVTSDTHYSHTNICRGTTKWDKSAEQTRDFPTLEAMNDALVNNINAKVGENDVLIHHGDFSFGGFDNIGIFRRRINCKNVHLILGNHDHLTKKNRDNVQSLFTSVSQVFEFEIVVPGVRQRFMSMHYPVISWEDMNLGVIHLHGHIHLPKHLRMREGKSMDVGVDGNDLMPYHINEILELMSKQPIAKSTLPMDHHD